jgi:hypothetical protein
MPADNTIPGIKEIRKLYSISAILGTQKKVIVCPLPFHPHANNSPSFSIYTTTDGIERWHCWGNCNRRGDIIDMIGYTTQGEAYNETSKNDVLAAITTLRTGYKVCPPAPTKTTGKRKNLPYDLWKAFPLGDKVIAYGKKRGLKPETLEAFGVGQADEKSLARALEMVGEEPWKTDRIYMTMPTFHFGTLKMIKMRWIDAPGKKQRFMAFPGSAPGIFGFSDIFNVTEPLAIVKGEISKMVLWERGLENVGAPNVGESAMDETWGVWTRASRNVITIGDNDPEKVAVKLAVAYERRCRIFRSKLYFPPNQFHDVDDWLLGDKAALDQIKRWLNDREETHTEH